MNFSYTNESLVFIYNLLQSNEYFDPSIFDHLNSSELVDLVHIHINEYSFETGHLILNFALKRYPDESQFADLKIQTFILEKKYQPALIFLNSTLSNTLGYFDHQIITAELLLNMGKFKEAKSILNFMKSQTDEQESTILYQKGMVYLKEESRYLAEEKFKEAILLWPENQLAQHELGKILQKENRFEVNFNFFEEILEHNAFAYQIWFFKGKVHLLRGETDMALECFDFSYLSCEKFTPAIEAKLNLYLELNKYEHALEELILIIENFDPTVEHYLKTATCFNNLGKEDKAMQILQFALELFPDEEELFYQLAKLEVKSGHHLKALDFIHQSLVLNGELEDSHLLAADIYQALDNTVMAINHLNESIALDDINHKAWVKLISIYLENGETEKCLEYIAKARLSVYHPEVELFNSLILFEMGQRSEAFTILNDIIEEDLKTAEKIFKLNPLLREDTEINALFQIYQPL